MSAGWYMEQTEGRARVIYRYCHAEAIAHSARIGDIIACAARALTPRRGAVIVKLEGDADHFGAGACCQRSHHRM